MVAKTAIPEMVVIGTAIRNLPQTGGGILDQQLLQDLFNDQRIRAGLAFSLVVGRSRVCRFPVSGARSTLRVCGKRAPAGESYCAQCRRLVYYRADD